MRAGRWQLVGVDTAIVASFVIESAIDLVYITPSGDSCLGIYIGANDRAKASTAG